MWRQNIVANVELAIINYFRMVGVLKFFVVK